MRKTQRRKQNAENQKRLATRTLQCIAPSNVETVNFRLNVEDSNMGLLTTLQNSMDSKAQQRAYRQGWYLNPNTW